MQRRIASIASAAVIAAAGAAAIGCGSSSSSSKAQSTTPSTSNLSGLDQEYLMTSAEGDAFEVQGGKIALSKSSKASVTKLGKRLQKDHSKSLKETQALAKKLGVKVDNKPSPPESWELQVVQSKSGADFDKWYSQLEVQDHMQDITETSFEIAHGQNPQVLAAAKKELPELKTHLKLSKAAAK